MQFHSKVSPQTLFCGYPFIAAEYSSSLGRQIDDILRTDIKYYLEHWEVNWETCFELGNNYNIKILF